MTFLKLLRYELKKIFCQKSIFVISVILLAVSFYNIYSASGADGFFKQSRESVNLQRATIYGKYSFELTEENITAFMADYNRIQAEAAVSAGEKTDFDKYVTGTALGDAFYMEEIKTEMERVYYYNDKVYEIRRKAYLLANRFDGVNDYLFRQNAKITNIYSERKIESFANTRDIPTYLEYKFSSLGVMIIILLGLTTKFAQEAETGMEQTIKSCRYGRLKSNAAKLLSGYIFVFVTAVVFYLFDFVVFRRCYLFSGLDSKLFSLEKYGGTTLNITILQTILLLFLLRLMGLLIFSSLVMLFSACFRSSVATYALSGAAVVVLILLSVVFPLGVGEYINLCNPIRLINAQSMFESYRTMNFFSYPVFKAYAAVIAGAGVFVLTMAFTLIVGSRYKSAKPKRRVTDAH